MSSDQGNLPVILSILAFLFSIAVPVFRNGTEPPLCDTVSYLLELVGLMDQVTGLLNLARHYSD